MPYKQDGIIIKMAHTQIIPLHFQNNTECPSRNVTMSSCCYVCEGNTCFLDHIQTLGQKYVNFLSEQKAEDAHYF